VTLTLASLRDADLARFCSLPAPDGPDPGQVRSHGPDALILVDGAGTPAARASLWWRRVPPYPGERIGLIGHYAAADARAAAAVLSAACAELARRGCTLAVGPMDGSTWRRYRLLTGRGAEPPFFLEPDNPDDWPGHFESQGFTPLARYVSALHEDLGRSWTASPAAEAFAFRPLAPGRIDAELRRLWRVSTRAFTDNFLYTPIGEAEFRAMYRRLLPLVRPELVLFAERDGEAAGFCFALPDRLQALRGEAVDTVIVKTVAVLPEWRGRGLGGALIARVGAAALRLGLRRSIHALMHEDNPSRKIGGGLLRDFRRYTLYGRRL